MLNYKKLKFTNKYIKCFLSSLLYSIILSESVYHSVIKSSLLQKNIFICSLLVIILLNLRTPKIFKFTDYFTSQQYVLMIIIAVSFSSFLNLSKSPILLTIGLSTIILFYFLFSNNTITKIKLYFNNFKSVNIVIASIVLTVISYSFFKLRLLPTLGINGYKSIVDIFYST